jgi:hypothetical protein
MMFSMNLNDTPQFHNDGDSINAKKSLLADWSHIFGVFVHFFRRFFSLAGILSFLDWGLHGSNVLLF